MNEDCDSMKRKKDEGSPRSGNDQVQPADNAATLEEGTNQPKKQKTETQDGVPSATAPASPAPTPGGAPLGAREDGAGGSAAATAGDSAAKGEGTKELSATMIELEKKRTSLLQKLVNVPNMDASTTSVLQDVGAGLRYGRYAATHKPKPKAKSKGWQFHYNKETGGTDRLAGGGDKKKKRVRTSRRSTAKTSSTTSTSKSTTTTTMTTTSATMVTAVPQNGVMPPAPVMQPMPMSHPVPYSHPNSTPYTYSPPMHYPPDGSAVPYVTPYPASYTHPAYPPPYHQPIQSHPYSAVPPGYLHAGPPPAPPTTQSPAPTQRYTPAPTGGRPGASGYPAAVAHPASIISYNDVVPCPLPAQGPGTGRQGTVPDFLQTALTYMELYKRNLWVFGPLPPAVVEEATARYFLATTKGAEEYSVLALSFYVCLCRGAMLAGDVDVSNKYYAKAEQMSRFLEGLRDMMTNYVFASALLALAQHGLYYMVDSEKVEFQLRMAMRICIKLNAFNSDVYARCLYLLVSRPGAKTSEVKHLNKELEKVKRQPYFVMKMNTTVGPGGVVHSEEGGVGGVFLDAEVGDGEAMDGQQHFGVTDEYYRGQASLLDVGRYTQMDIHTTNNNSEPSAQASSLVSMHNMNAIKSVFVVAAPVERGISLYKNEASSAGGNASDRLAGSLSQLLELIEKLETEVKMLQITTLDPLPGAIVKFVKLFSLASRAELYELMKDDMSAFNAAARFFGKTRKHKYRYTFEGAARFLPCVLRVFLAANRLDYFSEQLDAIDTWVKLVPLVKSTVAPFISRVASPKRPQQLPAPGHQGNGNSNGKVQTRQQTVVMASPSSSASYGGGGGILLSDIDAGEPHDMMPALNGGRAVASNGRGRMPLVGCDPFWAQAVGADGTMLSSDHGVMLNGSPGAGAGAGVLLKQHKQKKRMLKEKIEIMQDIMEHLKKGNANEVVGGGAFPTEYYLT